MYKHLYLIYGSKADALSQQVTAVRAFRLGEGVADEAGIYQKDQIHEPMIKRKGLRNLK
jgi:hypothetical protein